MSCLLWFTRTSDLALAISPDVAGRDNPVFLSLETSPGAH